MISRASDDCGLRTESPGLKPLVFAAFFAGLKPCASSEKAKDWIAFFNSCVVKGDVAGPWAFCVGVGGGAETGEGLEVVGEVGLVVVAAGEG